MTFVFIHGSFEHTTDAWFPWLKEQLEKLGHEVFLPQFPVDNWFEVSLHGAKQYKPTQNLSSWIQTFEQIQPEIQKDSKLCFIGHSLGPLFLLHLIEKYLLPQ